MSKSKSELLAKGGNLLTQNVVDYDIVMTVFNELNKTDQFILRKIRRVKSINSLRFIVAAGVVYYLYFTVNERLKVLEKAK